MDDFKAKADSMETASVLEKVSGGATGDCHCEDQGNRIACRESGRKILHHY